MPPRLFRLVLVTALLATLSTLACAADARPNFLIILADDLGYGDVGFQGGVAKTPHLDRLASQSVRLTAHYVHPMCSPSRAALLTGRYASRFGVTGAQNAQALPFGTPTLASILAGAGYDTALIGKWHLGSSPDTPPNKFGFACSYGSLAGGITSDTHEYKTGPHQKTWHRNGVLLEEPGHVTDLITTDAVKWIEQRGDAPFFLYVPYTAVHVPIQEPEEWLAMNSHLTDEATRLRAADISHLDDGVGRLLAALEKKGLRKNTVVLFLSDNGAHNPTDNRQDKYPGADSRKPLMVSGSNAPFRGWKSGLYEGGIRTPALASWEGKWKPGVLAQPLSVTNWLPTLCRLAGAPLPAGHPCDGWDAGGLLAGEAGADDTAALHPIYSAAPGFRARMVRLGGWKLIVTVPRGKRSSEAGVELYKIDDDPSETRNVAASFPDKVLELQTLLEKLAASDDARATARDGD